MAKSKSSDEPKAQRTLPQFAAFPVPASGPNRPLSRRPAAKPGRRKQPTASSRPPTAAAESTPLLDIEVTHEHGPLPRSTRPRRVLEIWTQHSIYQLDARMRCVAVMDRGTGTERLGHAFVGMHLVGGHANHEDRIELCEPLPRPGNEAVFEIAGPGDQGQFSHTSPVERVVLRYSVVSVTPASGRAPTWNEITGVVDEMD